MNFFDSHAHYDDEKFNEDREKIIQELYKNNITNVITAGYSLKSSIEASDIADEYDYIYATAGISPNDINNFKEEDLKTIKDIAKNNKKVIAIGEIGLDYYWNKDNKETQKEIFKKQIKIANELNLPIVIHTREAIYDTIEILKNEECVKKGVLHCCPFNVDLIREALKLGYYISFAGPVTFKNSKNAKEIVEMVPLEKILIETDSPYLSPEPLRGTRNNSINVKLIAQKIAEIKGVALEEVAKITYQNAETIFEI